MFDHEILIHYKSGGVVVLHVGVVVPTRPVVVLVLVVAKGGCGRFPPCWLIRQVEPADDPSPPISRPEDHLNQAKTR